MVLVAEDPPLPQPLAGLIESLLINHAQSVFPLGEGKKVEEGGRKGGGHLLVKVGLIHVPSKRFIRKQSYSFP